MEIPASGGSKRRVLLAALVPRLGSSGAHRFLEELLEDSSRPEVPLDSTQFDSFVRDEVVPRLMPLCRVNEIEELTQQTLHREAPESAPSSRRRRTQPATRARKRVVVLDHDGARARELCRVLVRDGYDVEVISSCEAVPPAGCFDVLVMRNEPGVELLLAELSRGNDELGVVAYDDPDGRTLIRHAIGIWPNDRFTLAANDAAPSLVAARVRIVADGV